MIMPGPAEQNIRTTGGQVDAIVMSLIDAAYDKVEGVRDIICISLHSIGKKKPELVLSSCYSYLKKHPKLQQGHRIVILSTIEKVCRDTLNELTVNMATDLVKQASEEMTQTKDVIPDWQTAASGIMVALGLKFCHEVMEELLKKFQPGVLPHFFVVQTMANLAKENVFGMVPFLKAVLGTMLPMLGMAKHDNIKWVFSSAMAKFSEAILEYVANIENAPDPTVRVEIYSNEFSTAYDVLFNSWMQTKETKLQVAIVEALGYMSHLLPREKMNDHLPKLVQGMLNMYRRQLQPYHISQSLSMVLDAASNGGHMLNEQLLENVFATLLPQVCTMPDYNAPLNVKNFNEVLRCFTVIARSSSDKLVTYLLQKIDNNNEKVRIGTLTVIKHLINSCGAQLVDKQATIISGLKNSLQEPNNKVKKVLAHLVLAMAHHGLLELESGQLMVEFIVRQCALTDDTQTRRPTDLDYISNDCLRLMCEDVMHLLTTTVDNMDKVLWPNLLEYLLPEHLTEAMGTVCKNLAFLLAKKLEETPNYEIEFQANVNLPKPHDVFARLMVMGGHPHSGRKRGPHVLKLMEYMASNFHTALPSVWEVNIEKLENYWKDLSESDDWSQRAWEELLLKLLQESLDAVNNENWVTELGNAFINQIPSYEHHSDEKSFLFKCLGYVLKKCNSKLFVNKNIDVIFSSTKHSSVIERQGCAMGLGVIAASHLDAVLNKLEILVKSELSKKSSGILGFIKEMKSEPDVDRVKATILLTYGFVALNAPSHLVISRVETTILSSILPYTNNLKDPVVKTCFIRCVELIAIALHPSRLHENKYQLNKRGDLLNQLQNFMKAENTNHLNNSIRAFACGACAQLINLDPKLDDDTLDKLIKIACSQVYPITPEYPKKKIKEEIPDDSEYDVLLLNTLQALNDMLIGILKKNILPSTLMLILQHLKSYLHSSREHERDRSIKTLQFLLEAYLECVDHGGVAPTPFNELGSLLARIVPRCTDPCVNIRERALSCVQTTLRISLRYEGYSSEEQDKILSALPSIKEGISKDDPTQLFNALNQLASILCKRISGEQLTGFIQVLLEGLLDSQAHSSSGTSVVLNDVLKIRGAELHSQVNSIIDQLQEQLPNISCSKTRKGSLRCIRTMANHHLTDVLTCLLSYPIPLDENLVDCWKILAEEPFLTRQMIEYLLDALSRNVLYEDTRKDHKDKYSNKNATIYPLQVLCALSKIFGVPEAQENILKDYHRLFSTLLVVIGTYVTVESPKTPKEDKTKEPKTEREKRIFTTWRNVWRVSPSKVAIECLKEFLTSTSSVLLIDEMTTQNCWLDLESPQNFADAVAVIAKSMSVNHPKYISNIVVILNNYLSSLYDEQRIVAVAYFAELISQRCCGDHTLVEMLMNSLLGRLVDNNHVVRKLCIRGLGYIANIGTTEVHKHSTTVLSAMMAGMDDKEDVNDDITLEAMSGLSKILAAIDETSVRGILINIALRIRPCFEKEKASVRAAAFTLFGNLFRFGDGPSKLPFLEQIHNNFVSLLLHLKDEDQEVIKACKFALRLLGPLLGSSTINDMFQKHLFEASHLHYGEFINDLAKAIIVDFVDKVNFYVMSSVTFFKSSWPVIQSNAAMFVGFLLGNLPHERHHSISKEHVCTALIILLKDSSPEVRIKAAEAMSWLHDY